MQWSRPQCCRHALHGLRDAIIAHPTMGGGLGALFSNVPARDKAPRTTRPPTNRAQNLQGVRAGRGNSVSRIMLTRLVQGDHRNDCYMDAS